MAHNTRARADWNDGDVPVESEFDKLDQNGFTAVNGDDGGAWAPAAPIDIGGQGLRARLVYDLVVVGPNANTTFTIATTRVIYLDATVAADRVYTLSATGAVAGDILEIFVLPAFNSARTVTVNDNLGAAIATMGLTSGRFRSAKFVYLAGSWRLMSSSRVSAAVVADIAGYGSFTEQSLSTTSFTDFPGVAVSMICEAGDILLVQFDFGIELSTGASGSVQAVAVTPGPTTTVVSQGNYIAPGSGGITMFSYATFMVVPTSGTVIWKLRGEVGTGSQTITVGNPASRPGSINVLKLRPT